MLFFSNIIFDALGKYFTTFTSFFYIIFDTLGFYRSFIIIWWEYEGKTVQCYSEALICSSSGTKSEDILIACNVSQWDLYNSIADTYST